MRSVFSILFCAMCLCAVAPSSQANIVFRIAQTTPAPPEKVPGNTPTAAVFGVFVSSSTPDQTLRGVDFDLFLSNQSGAAGRMVSGTNNLLVTNPSNAAGFFPGSFPGTYVIYGNSARSVDLSAERLFATVTLSTEGAVAGDYSISLANIVALDIDDFSVPISPNSVLSANYSIAGAAVPEPTSIALVCAAGMGLWGFRRRGMAS